VPGQPPACPALHGGRERRPSVDGGRELPVPLDPRIGEHLQRGEQLFAAQAPPGGLQDPVHYLAGLGGIRRARGHPRSTAAVAFSCAQRPSPAARHRPARVRGHRADSGPGPSAGRRPDRAPGPGTHRPGSPRSSACAQPPTSWPACSSRSSPRCLPLHGRHAVRARLLNAASAGTSVFMNVIAAGRGWRDMAVWVMPPAAWDAERPRLGAGAVRAHRWSSGAVTSNAPRGSRLDEKVMSASWPLKYCRYPSLPFFS
jgi:hypothetical protein